MRKRILLLVVGTLLLVTAASSSVFLQERPVTPCSVVADVSGRVFGSLVASALPPSGSGESIRSDVELVLVDSFASRGKDAGGLMREAAPAEDCPIQAEVTRSCTG